MSALLAPLIQPVIRAGTVSASVMLRKLAGFPRQNSVARALREIGRIERTLFMLDWFDDPDQRRRTGSILNKGEARNALARALFFNQLGELRDLLAQTGGSDGNDSGLEDCRHDVMLLL
jgi:TnpA family transposase